jgi:hypothetical protein
MSPPPAQVQSRTPAPAAVMASPTATVSATPTPTPTPDATIEPAAGLRIDTPIPADWQTYTDPALQLTLRYPAGWKAVSRTRYAGADGFFELSGEDYPAFTIDNLLSKCVLAANEDKPEAFGPFPVIGVPYLYAPGAFLGTGREACTVVPEQGQPGKANQAVLYARLPLPQPADTLLTLRTDPEHFSMILGSLQFEWESTPTPAVSSDSPACAQAPAGKPLTVSRFGDLTISEYAIAPDGCDPLEQADGFAARVQQLEPQLAEARARSASRQAAALNTVLAPFGYQLQVAQPAAPSFDLYQGGSLLLAGITRLGPISLNAKKDDFIFWVQGAANHGLPVEVRKGKLHEALSFLEGERSFSTLWVGADLLSYETLPGHLSGQLTHSQVGIQRNGQLEATVALPLEGSDAQSIQGFGSWQGHWLLEVGGMVIQDGQVLNRHYGYDEMFDWHLVNGRPFFFYHQSGHFGIFYDGLPIQHRYNDILHGEACCALTAAQIVDSPDGVWFYARKGKIWYLVSILGGG